MFVLNLLKDTLVYVVSTLIHNAPSLALGILVAAAISTYVDPARLKKSLMKNSGISIPGSVAFGAFTPFCACGTMAVIISMMAAALPWGPIMAFLTSSPLMSPDEFIMYAGIISPQFAVVLTIASIIIGLYSGFITHLLEKKTSYLKDQIRFIERDKRNSCSCSSEPAKDGVQLADTYPESSEPEVEVCACSCGCVVSKSVQPPLWERLKLDKFLRTIYDVGIKKVLFYFAIFAAVGYFINRFIPTSIITALFGAKNIFSVPLAAIIGLPLYVSGSSSIPIIKSLMDGGASGGAMLAFMITGPGTSAGVIAGIATIMKKKAIALYVAYILFGGIILGYLYDLYLAAL